jgi:hypothetical protein
LVIKIIVVANKNKNLWKYCDLSAVTPPQIVLFPLPATAQNIRFNILDIIGLIEKKYNKF